MNGAVSSIIDKLKQHLVITLDYNKLKLYLCPPSISLKIELNNA